MRVSPPNEQSVDAQSPSQDPMAEKEPRKGQYSSCLLVESPVVSMAQTSSWALLLPSVATWRERRKQGGKKVREGGWVAPVHPLIHHACAYVWLYKGAHTDSSYPCAHGSTIYVSPTTHLCSHK